MAFSYEYTGLKPQSHIGAVPCWTVSQTRSSGANRVGSGVIGSCTMIIRGVAWVKNYSRFSADLPRRPLCRYDPTRTAPVHHGSTQFWRSSRFTPVVFDMSKTAGVAHDSPRTIPDHPGIATVRPPVHPGSPRFMNRDEPVWTGSHVGL